MNTDSSYYTSSHLMSSSSSHAGPPGGNRTPGQTPSKAQQTPLQKRVGNYCVNANAVGKMETDLSTKLFSFAFLCELIQEKLGGATNLQGYLQEIFTQRPTGFVDLNEVFHFLVNIQDFEEEQIEEFFEHCPVEKLHAAHLGREGGAIGPHLNHPADLDQGRGAHRFRAVFPEFLAHLARVERSITVK